MENDKINERAEWLREQIRKMEEEKDSIAERISDYRKLLFRETTGRPAPAKSSASGRPSKAVKKILASGPATRDEILTRLKNDLFDFKDEPGKTVDKTLKMCVHAGTIIQDGEMYRLP